MNLTESQKSKVKEIISKMTLEEKIGQLNQESPSIVGGFDVPFEELIEMMVDGRISKEEFGKILSTAEQDFHEDDIRAGLVGSLILQDPHKVNELQKIAVEENRLGIPLIIGYDIIHGLRSVYPIAIAEAGAFDTDLFERTAHMAAKESRSRGISWNFAPMIDIARDARWGRVSEGPGEDHYLASQFARAKVRGLQGDTSSHENYVAACLKHYVAYGACESGRDYNTTTMSNSLLHNVYLAPFKAAVKEGAATAMASFNDLNGVPCTVNEYTLRKILKEDYGLNGFVVSDANGIKECITHGIAEDELDAGRQAINAGLDMDMGTNIYKNNIKEALKKGLVTEETINEAVERVLSVKVWLGLFDNPYISEETIKKYEDIPKEHRMLALESAKKSIVLLKNEGNILPLDKKKKVTLVGELADNKEEVIGAWAMSWKEKDCVTILDGIRNKNIDVEYYPCGGPEGELNEEEIKLACNNGDVIVAVIGEKVSMSGEASSKTNIELPGKQREMLEKLLASGKPVVAILMNGRPLALSWENENIPAIIEGWHLGIEMGNAISEVLFGDYNPSGKLSVSFPAVTGQCPIYYNHPSTGRPGSKSKFTSRYLDAPFTPLYPFGYGLSYTTFKYEDMEIKEDDESVTVSVIIENCGNISGTETVQLYMRDIVASIVRPVKELKGFKKVTLNPGEKEKISINILKKDMGFYNNEGKYILEDGKFNLYIGGSSNECLSKEIIIK